MPEPTSGKDVKESETVRPPDQITDIYIYKHRLMTAPLLSRLLCQHQKSQGKLDGYRLKFDSPCY